MPCLFYPQPKRARPLNLEEARKALGENAKPGDIYQAQKLFTCEHGVTLNWKLARAALGLN